MKHAIRAALTAAVAFALTLGAAAVRRRGGASLDGASGYWPAQERRKDGGRGLPPGIRRGRDGQGTVP